MPAVAYINHGRWIADCPAGCNGAMDLNPGQAYFLCGVLRDGLLLGGCGATDDLLWPADVEAISTALAGRPAAHAHWAPAGHRQTYVSRNVEGNIVADAFPGGQTADDLLEEV